MQPKSISLSVLEDKVTLKTPARINIPKLWLMDNAYLYDTDDEKVWVEVTYVERQGSKHDNCKYIWFMTKEHGKSASLHEDTLVEIKDTTLDAGVKLGYGRSQTVRGISIE